MTQLLINLAPNLAPNLVHFSHSWPPNGINVFLSLIALCMLLSHVTLMYWYRQVRSHFLDLQLLKDVWLVCCYCWSPFTQYVSLNNAFPYSPHLSNQGDLEPKFRTMIYYNAFALFMLCICANIYIYTDLARPEPTPQPNATYTS